MARVLIADDDRTNRESLAAALRLRDFEVVACRDGVDALAAHHRSRADALVLDVRMPGVDGLGVCRLLRAEGERVPILIASAMVETGDRIAGLDAGADDYAPKPYRLEDVLARLRALLRRPPATGDSLIVGPVRLDPGARRVWGGGEEAVLSVPESQILQLLMANAGTVLERQVIEDRIWGHDFGAATNLAVHLAYLRRKLGPPGDEYIRTVDGAGYVFGRA